MDFKIKMNHIVTLFLISHILTVLSQLTVATSSFSLIAMPQIAFEWLSKVLTISPYSQSHIFRVQSSEPDKIKFSFNLIILHTGAVCETSV